jgi:hypothetical protein
MGRGSPERCCGEHPDDAERTDEARVDDAAADDGERLERDPATEPVRPGRGKYVPL